MMEGWAYIIAALLLIWITTPVDESWADEMDKDFKEKNNEIDQ